MSELTEAIDAFLAKYPDDAVLEWCDKSRKPDALNVMVADLVTAGERWRQRVKHIPSASDDHRETADELGEGDE